MSSIVCLINQLCAELRSEKVTTRNKAAEQLENHLGSSKNELFAKLPKRDETNVSWTTIFNSVVDATIKHAIKVDESKDTKSQAPLLNKNYLYSSIVNKLINYNLEDPEHLFNKATLFNGFQEGFKSRVAVLYFNDIFLCILNQGLFKSAVYIRDMKVNEFSLILSYLFETNKGTDDLFRFASLKAITKTIELSHEYVQMSADVIAYFPEIHEFANRAIKDGQKSEVIKLYFLMISQHSVDYHNIICTDFQVVLPIIIGFYQYNMKAETKELLFKSILISLQALYPYIHQGDTNTINITLHNTWTKTIRKLKTLIEIEIKERKSSHYQLSRSQHSDKSLEVFVKMSALVMYLFLWHFDNNTNDGNSDKDSSEQKSKISRPADKIEILLDLVQPQKLKYNDIWLAILAELVTAVDTIVNVANYQQLLKLTLNILEDYSNGRNMQCIRLLLTKLLVKEKEFVATKSIPDNYCHEEWLQIKKTLINDTSSCSDVIAEKQKLLQKLILHRKLSVDCCTTLINSFITNAALRRTECVQTLKEIFKNADHIGLDKTSNLVGQCISWLYGDKDRNEAKSILLHIEPIKPQLIADTCAIAVINFLSEASLNAKFTAEDSILNDNLQNLQFKYIRKFLCLECHAKALQLHEQTTNLKTLQSPANCLFQCNYELLMRTVNFETTQGTSCKDILEDLTSLQKISMLMKSLLEHGVFDDNSFMQCPLIKRIGFFLSHLELQFKNNSSTAIERSTLSEILNLLEYIIKCFTSNVTLLQYLEKQPIEEMIQFLGTSLKICAKNSTTQTEFDDWTSIADKILCLLANLCASSSHWKEAFEYVAKYNFNTKTQTAIILQLTKIFCRQKSRYVNIGSWFVNKLKTTFKLYYSNIEIMNSILEIIPDIFVYIQLYEDSLDDMLLAMYSLFKIAFRKSYSTKMTAKIITSICYIARDCRNIYVQDNFRNLCFSIVNFLPFPSLDIQYAAINTITALMDINWLKNTKCDIDLYYDFCDNIYELIKWKKLQVAPTQAESADQLQNAKSLNVQLLVGILAFSCYHRSNALQELSHVCAFYKFTEADFIEYHRIASFYKTSTTELLKTNIPSAIHTWISKSFPILKFPFYLCYKTKNDFLSDNIDLITTCLLLYNKSDEIKNLEQFGDMLELLKMATPIINFFILVAQCPANENNELKKYVQNMLKLKLDFSKTKSDNNTWKVVYALFDALHDDGDSKLLAGFPMFLQTPKWYNINNKCLRSALNVYINSNPGEVKPELLLNYISKHSLRLVKTFGALKRNCSQCIYPMDSLKQFYKFYKLSDMVLDTLAVRSAALPQHLCFYFLHDIIYYCLHCIETAADTTQSLRKVALTGLEKLTTKIIDIEDINSFMQKHLSFICKSLVYTHKRSNSIDEQTKITSICEHLISNYKKAISDKHYMLNIFANNENFNNVNKLLETLSENISDDDNADCWKKYLDIFMENTNYTLDSFKFLQQHIAANKHIVQADKNVLYRLIRHLLQFLRQSEDEALNLEVLKCLGEIGPLNLYQMSYYFEVENSIDEDTNSAKQIENFYNNIYLILEHLLNKFNPNTHLYVIDVAQYLVNSKYGQDLMEKFPTFMVFRANVTQNYMDLYESITPANWCDTLKSCEHMDYDNFIRQFVAKIYDHCCWLQFRDLSKNDLYFAEHSITPFIKLLLHCEEGENHKTGIMTMLEYFFETFQQQHKTDFVGCENKMIYKEKRIVNLILNICECIRINNSWDLPLNLLNVVEACNYCQAYFLSIIYLEMWALGQISLGDKTNVEILSNESFQRLARKAYDAIGCNDAISGFINPLTSRMDYLNLTNNWPDILIETTDTSDMCNEVLKRNGMLNLACSSADNRKQNVDYEICWRLCRWDTVVEGHSKVNTLNDMEYEFEKHHFNALKCLNNKEENNTLAAIEKSRHCVLNILKEISVECLQSVYKYLTWLQLLQQCEDFCLIQFSKSTDVDHIFKKWQLETNDLEYGLFSSKELILSHQISLFQTAGIRASRKIKEFYKDDPVEKCLLKCIRDCKAAGEINLAKRYVAILNNMCSNSSASLKISALLEDVDICMKTGKSDMVKSILHHIFKNREFQYCLQRVKAMQLNGQYLMDTNAETFENVLRKYFMGSLDVLGKYSQSKDVILQKFPNLFTLEEFEVCQAESKKSAYEIIAKYADREYVQLNNYANSDQFAIKRQTMKLNREAVSTINPRSMDHDKRVAASFMKKTSHMDEQEIAQIENKVTSNLCTAVENYMKFSCLDNAISSPVIYRIIGLWFANKQNDTLRATIQEHIDAVPSYKFICALNQMTARLNSKHDEFIKILKNIMIRCVQEHPHHTLYQLYPIVYGYMDGTQNKADYRSKLAQEIIAKAKSKINANTIKQLESVIPALIEFANTEIKDNKEPSISLSEKLRRMKSLDAIHCPTIDLPVRIDRNYTIKGIVKWESQVGLVGGINAPKKLSCLCSDGIKRPQLLKGKDDLRQDAVMQQVFCMINNLLQQEPKAVQRKLLIRTYKVIPLSTRSGLLEWCQNTVPIGMYLTQAHQKYRPKDYTVMNCRKLAHAHLKSNPEKRHETYINITKHIQPVFHYFFYEKFLKPGIWFERRLAYINSVATTSMVGYILGLGDRHTQNILIDQNSAEVIHIDFGIAFEQGKIMPTPETVPFRLTRDMLAPMGICGPNGVFKKSCETTMEILRRHQDVITTILEVLLYDPLYIWNVVPQINDNDNNNTTEEKNHIAQRALIVVQNKLEGKQNGIFGTSSVPVQVERLINDAINTRNLCMLFSGWDPYL
ncbi:serine/threonine-protein kinase ATM [Musca domestica]|uniref:non-specific serine/threonine protein kinase n=1 Tax=Musca domestica TaxID=7370 RepID=A0A9J7CQJ0_MUSDO|nr:serine/threonine-protein kinase ATM [Musca domestica]